MPPPSRRIAALEVRYFGSADSTGLASHTQSSRCAGMDPSGECSMSTFHGPGRPSATTCSMSPR
ncbi:hypothetical protein ACGFZA_09750 [Streptomyces sp. NPDC048211]|uniref:hypothetical protein n=1 Tax=Streptomyces sp. NPDC048211 TaxID=3365516 RepID=UPI003719C0B2